MFSFWDFLKLFDLLNNKMPSCFKPNTLLWPLNVFRNNFFLVNFQILAAFTTNFKHMSYTKYVIFPSLILAGEDFWNQHRKIQGQTNRTAWSCHNSNNNFILFMYLQIHKGKGNNEGWVGSDKISTWGKSYLEVLYLTL